VRLVDPVPLHIEQALAASDAQPASRFEAVEGDARSLQEPDVAYDAVLLMGPLYHLIERADRVRALEEARRVARPGGRVIAVVISRFASYLDGLRRGWLRDPLFGAMADEDLRSGQHRNPEPERRPDWFTTAYLHRPEEVSAELSDAGLTLQALVGVEGPGWLVHDGDAEEWRRAASMLEHEPSLLGVSAHLMAIATRPRD
jgi:ubiquinone/menaquinone biosynthesis C-methylase UbiE